MNMMRANSSSITLPAALRKSVINQLMHCRTLLRQIAMLTMFGGLGMGLTACVQQTIAAEDCISTDWRAAGLKDGTEGRHFKILDTYDKQCGESFGKTQEGLWTKGYLEGMEVFCTETNGFRDGQASSTIINTCPKDSAYFAGYKRGHQAFMDEQERVRIEKLTRPAPDNGQRAGKGTDT